jgi:hypothetical protein
VFSPNPVVSLPLAESAPRIGAPVYAIGSPHGFASSLSAGNVSGYRQIQQGVTWLQTTAPISPGSSGGPLMNSEGEVVGVTTLIWVEKESQNLNFAIPVSEIRRFLSEPYHVEPNEEIAGPERGEIPEPPKEKWSREEKEEAAHLVRALRRSNDAVRVWFNLRDAKLEQITKKQIDAIAKAADEAFEEAQLVRRGVLEKLHPALPFMFKESFIPGARIARGAMIGNLSAEKKEYAQLFVDWFNHMANWSKWWDSNHMDLDMPEGIPLWDAKDRNVQGYPDGTPE